MVSRLSKLFPLAFIPPLAATAFLVNSVNKPEPVYILDEPQEEIVEIVEEPSQPEPIISYDDEIDTINEYWIEETLPFSGGYSQEELELLALITFAEAEAEPELGQRYVIDTVLNRVDSPRFGDTIFDVLTAPNQYTSRDSIRFKRSRVTPEIMQLIEEELANRTNSDVLYFRTEHYHNFGTPIEQVCCHYFSGV